MNYLCQCHSRTVPRSNIVIHFTCWLVDKRGLFCFTFLKLYDYTSLTTSTYHHQHTKQVWVL